MHSIVYTLDQKGEASKPSFIGFPLIDGASLAVPVKKVCLCTLLLGYLTVLYIDPHSLPSGCQRPIYLRLWLSVVTIMYLYTSSFQRVNNV